MATGPDSPPAFHQDEPGQSRNIQIISNPQSLPAALQLRTNALYLQESVGHRSIFCRSNITDRSCFFHRIHIYPDEVFGVVGIVHEPPIRPMRLHLFIVLWWPRRVCVQIFSSVWVKSTETVGLMLIPNEVRSICSHMSAKRGFRRRNTLHTPLLRNTSMNRSIAIWTKSEVLDTCR